MKIRVFSFWNKVLKVNLKLKKCSHLIASQQNGVTKIFFDPNHQRGLISLLNLLWYNFWDLSLNWKIGGNFKPIFNLWVELERAVSWNCWDSQLIWVSFGFNQNSKDGFSINAFYIAVRNLVVSMFKRDINNWTILETKVECILEKEVGSDLCVDFIVCDLIEYALLHVPKIQCGGGRHNVMSLHVVLKCFKEEDGIFVLEVPEFLLSFLLYFLVHFLISPNYKIKGQSF